MRVRAASVSAGLTVNCASLTLTRNDVGASAARAFPAMLGVSMASALFAEAWDSMELALSAEVWVSIELALSAEARADDEVCP